MKHKVLPVRVDDELYDWLKDYARRKHSNMTAVITGLLVDHKDNDEMQQTERQAKASPKTTMAIRKK